MSKSTRPKNNQRRKIQKHTMCSICKKVNVETFSDSENKIVRKCKDCNEKKIKIFIGGIPTYMTEKEFKEHIKRVLK